MEEYIARRNKLAVQLENESIAILFGAKTVYRNNDTEYAFRQNSSFWYFTGFSEPDAIMVLLKDAKGVIKYILFSRKFDATVAIWNGAVAGQEGAIKVYGADEAYDVEEFGTYMLHYLAQARVLYYQFAEDVVFEQQISSYMHKLRTDLRRKSRNYPDKLLDLAPLIADLRVIKSNYEIEQMRRAISISAAGHRKLLQSCKPGMYEYQLAAIFNGHCMYEGCSAMAYSTIAAGGNNGCVLHYTSNSQQLKDGDLVLVDAGGEFGHYAADITTTFPVNGKFSVEQKEIYNLVLQAQAAGIAQIKPGNTWDKVQEVMVEIIVVGLVKLGLLSGDVKQLLAQHAYRKFYMHSSGHWLGLDVHDVGSYLATNRGDKWRKFLAGMVLTVEPGIYISENCTDVERRWRGIAVRIEDDVLVTARGHEVLSRDIPRTVEEIERAML